MNLGYVVWSWYGSFGHSKPGGLGPALAMVPTVENFCHAPVTNSSACECSTTAQIRLSHSGSLLTFSLK